MKKHVLFALGALVLMLASCQTTKAVKQETVSLDFSIDGGKILDSYWDQYFRTKDTSYLDMIIAYADSEDALVANINDAYANGKINDSWVEYLSLTNADGVLTSRYDMDYLSVHFIRYGDEEISNNMKALYSIFPKELLIRNSVKSSAYWSLYSNADIREDVKSYLIQKLPEMTPKTAIVFTDIFNICGNVEEE